MKYLDYKAMNALLSNHFPNDSARRIGSSQYDSGYYDIRRFFGPEAIDPSRITVEAQEQEFELTDPLIKAFAEEMEVRLRREGRLHDGPGATRVVAMDTREDGGRMVIQECAYGIQAGTSFALDLEHPSFREHGGTLRSYYLASHAGGPVGDNPLAICLGICGLLIARTNDGPHALVVRRSANLASLEDSVGPSAAGSVDWEPDYEDLDQLIYYSLGTEIEEELGLDRVDCRITPLAYAREIFRGEKPQLFCMIEHPGISTSFVPTDVPDEEFTESCWVKIDGGNDGSTSIGQLNHESRANYLLVEEYLASLKQA